MAIPLLKRFIAAKVTTTQRGSLSGPLKGDVIYDTDLNRLMVNVAADGATAVWEALNSTPRKLTVTQFRAYNPSHLEEVYVMDSLTTPTWWHHYFYDANDTSSYKWHFLGGDSLFAAAYDTPNANSNNAWQTDIVTPLLNPYRAGEWEIMWRVHPNAAGGTSLATALRINSVNQVSSDTAIWGNNTGTGFSGTDKVANGSEMMVERFVVPVDDAPVQMIFRTFNGLHTVGGRVLRMTPRRVA